MSWTKQQLISQAFSKIGMADYVYDIQPEQVQMVARELDSMLAEWDAMSISLGYALSGSDEVDVNQDSGLPSWAYGGVSANLAIRIAPYFGKALSQDLKQTAKAGYNAILNRAFQPIERQMPAGTIMGAGNSRSFIRPFSPEFSPSLDTDSNSQIDYE